MVYQPKLEEKVYKIEKRLDNEMHGASGESQQVVDSSYQNKSSDSKKDKENDLLTQKMQDVKNQLE